MAVTVTFTGTPLSGTDQLSVTFTSVVTIEPSGGGTSRKKPKKRTIKFSDFSAREALAAEVKNATAEIVTPAMPVAVAVETDDSVIAVAQAAADTAQMVADAAMEQAEMMEIIAVVQEIERRLH